MLTVCDLIKYSVHGDQICTCWSEYPAQQFGGYLGLLVVFSLLLGGLLVAGKSVLFLPSPGKHSLLGYYGFPDSLEGNRLFMFSPFMFVVDCLSDL